MVNDKLSSTHLRDTSCTTSSVQPNRPCDVMLFTWNPTNIQPQKVTVYNQTKELQIPKKKQGVSSIVTTPPPRKKLTNIYPLKIDGWKLEDDIFFLTWSLFRGPVNFQGGNYYPKLLVVWSRLELQNRSFFEHHRWQPKCWLDTCWGFMILHPIFLKQKQGTSLYKTLFDILGWVSVTPTSSNMKTYQKKGWTMSFPD